jgi:hypothetical protein
MIDFDWKEKKQAPPSPGTLGESYMESSPTHFGLGSVESTPEKSGRLKRQNSVPSLRPDGTFGLDFDLAEPRELSKEFSTPVKNGSPMLRRRNTQSLLLIATAQQLAEPESKGEEFVRKRLDLCEYSAPSIANVRSVMNCFTTLLLPKKNAEEMFSKFVATTTCAEGGERDLSIIVKNFFNTEFKDVADKTYDPSDNRRALISILKVCNQNIIFPAVYLLKQVILDPHRARDVHKRGGWMITIEFHATKTYVIHKRREVCDTGRFTYQWGLTLVFDVPSYDLVDTTLAITELNFQDDAIPRVKHDLSTRLFSVNRLSSIIAKKKKPRRMSAPARSDDAPGTSPTSASKKPR